MKDFRVDDLIDVDDPDKVAVEFIGGWKVGENIYCSWTYNQVISPALNRNSGPSPA